MTTTTDIPEPMRKLAAADARKRWKEMCENLRDMEQRVLMLMAHPDATQEQVMACKKVYMQAVASMKDTLLKLQERYPRTGSIFSPAWKFESLSGSWFIVVRKE